MQAWEELIAQGVKQGPFIAPALPKAEPSTHEQPATDAAELPAADTNEAEHPPTKAKRSHPGTRQLPWCSERAYPSSTCMQRTPCLTFLVRSSCVTPASGLITDAAMIRTALLGRVAAVVSGITLNHHMHSPSRFRRCIVQEVCVRGRLGPVCLRVLCGFATRIYPRGASVGKYGQCGYIPGAPCLTFAAACVHP